MTTNRHTLDKFWLFFGMLILISIGAITWCIFILIKKPQSHIIVGISVLIYLLYEVGSIVLMESCKSRRNKQMVTIINDIETKESLENKRQASNNIRKGLIESGNFDADTIDKIIEVFNTTAAHYTFSRKEQ